MVWRITSAEMKKSALPAVQTCEEGVLAVKMTARAFYRLLAGV